jgi:REP element-mobilizing transposase RayT
MYPPPGKSNAGKAFVWMDRYLDRQASGPLYLKQDAIAQIVVDSLFKGMELHHYDLGAFVIMANHVHVLLFPLVPPSRLLKALKGVTAYEANRVLSRTGERFWQRESYDHWVRDGAQFDRIVRYIEGNPVSAGIVQAPEEYIWSSANPKWAEALRPQEWGRRKHECLRHLLE